MLETSRMDLFTYFASLFEVEIWRNHDGQAEAQGIEEDHGLDGDVLEELDDQIEQSLHGFGLAIVYNGRLVGLAGIEIVVHGILGIGCLLRHDFTSFFRFSSSF